MALGSKGRAVGISLAALFEAESGCKKFLVHSTHEEIDISRLRPPGDTVVADRRGIFFSGAEASAEVIWSLVQEMSRLFLDVGFAFVYIEVYALSLINPRSLGV